MGIRLVLVPAALLIAGALRDDGPPVDLRTVVVLREDCASELARREVTLFANGTIRLREGAPGEEHMALGEVAGRELRAYRNRLAEIDHADLEVQSEGPVGDWVERCRLVLEPGSGTAFEISYGRYDSGSLALDGLRRIVEELVDLARQSVGSAEIPSGYVPRVGDRLERSDGAIFEIVSFTSDGKALEVRSDEPPLTLYIERSNVRREFVRLVPRQSPP